ncbi:MAG: hypothetical protein AB1324_02565 [Candidatus Micrarchaeota archaeon]
MKGTRGIMALTLAAFLIFLGCTGASEGDKCVGETSVTINGVTKVCVDGKMTGSCTLEGSVYKESEDSRIVCKGGSWVREVVEAGSAPAGDGGQQPAETAPSGETTTEPVAEGPEPCQGEGFASANDITMACVDGFWTTDCTTEGEVYMVTSFDTKVICRGGIWVEEDLAPGEVVEETEPEETSGEEGPCESPSWESYDNTTWACVGGVMVTECSTEGEVYDVSEFLEMEVVCEGGVWVAKDTG